MKRGVSKDTKVKVVTGKNKKVASRNKITRLASSGRFVALNYDVGKLEQELLKSKQSARGHLISIGIVTQSGRLTKKYK